METLKNLSGFQKFIIGLMVGLILGGAGSYSLMNKGVIVKGINDDEDAKNVGDEAKTVVDGSVIDAGIKTNEIGSKTVSVPGTNAVAADNQKAGSNVEVTLVTLSKAGWVVIHEDNNGTPGKVLGARRYDPGIYLGDVELLRVTEVGKMYHVMLHLDDGDRQFDLSKDLPIEGENGKMVTTTFKAE